MKAVFNRDISLVAMAAIIMSAIRADESAAKRIAALVNDTEKLSFIIDQRIEIPESISIVNTDVFETATGISVDVINDFEICVERNREVSRYEVFVHISGYSSEEEKKVAKFYNDGAKEYKLPLAFLPDYGMDWE